MFRRLKESSLMKHLMDNIKDNIYFMDQDGRIILVNKQGAKWLGFNSPEEVIGKTDLDIFTDEHGRDAYEDEQRIMRTGIPVLGKEEKETWADGHETWVSTSKMPLRDDAGEIVGVFGISRDITEHKKAEILAEKFAEENRRFREEMEDDLLMAAELQKTFFPISYPGFPAGGAAGESVVEFNHRHYSGGMVGGDFCSIRKLSDTEAGILLCDVMGHGVRAALGTAIVRAMVEELSLQKKEPGQFLQHINRVLQPILRQGELFLYATACYMVLDVTTGGIRYANAGHPVPIILKAQHERAEWFVDGHAATGPALAVSEEVAYETIERTIRPGDCVFMYTDGIYEVENADGEEFGEERLLSAARRFMDRPLADLFPSLLNEARQFADAGAFNDDVCLVGFSLRDLLSA
jgi:sigma-B regulation protein RsbU (phosphoserine phosphatase)